MSFRIEKELTTHPLGKLRLPGNSLDELQLLCDARTMRELDRNAIENIGIPGMVLMENAAQADAEIENIRYNGFAEARDLRQEGINQQLQGNIAQLEANAQAAAIRASTVTSIFKSSISAYNAGMFV